MMAYPLPDLHPGMARERSRWRNCGRVSQHGINSRERAGVRLAVLLDNAVIDLILKRGGFLAEGVVAVEAPEGVGRVEALPLLCEVRAMRLVGKDVVLAIGTAVVVAVGLESSPA
jgi:hypothetical protein